MHNCINVISIKYFEINLIIFKYIRNGSFFIMISLIYFCVFVIRILIVFVFIYCSFKFSFSENRTAELQILFETINYFIILFLTFSIIRDKLR